MKKRFCVILAIIFMLISFTFTGTAKENIIEDETITWRYVVPFCKYSHCEVLSNGLIKIGKTVGWDDWSNDATGPDPIKIYGLLDGKGNPFTDMIYNYISSPNSDGYMLARTNDYSKYVIFDNLGNILPTPENAVITLFNRSYCVETDDSFTCCVNGKSYEVLKSVIEENTGIKFDGESIYDINQVYGEFFVLRWHYDKYYNRVGAFIINYDGTVRFTTDKNHWFISCTPDGVIIRNEQVNQGLLDFDGNALIVPSYGKQIYAIGDSVTGELANGLYMFTMGGSNDWYIRDINNLKAFDGLTFSVIYFIDVKSKTICVEKTPGIGFGLYGFDGTEILSCKYHYIFSVSDGLIRYQTKQNGYGIANLKGEILFETDDYYLWWCFSEGLLDKDFKPVFQLDKDLYILDYGHGFHDGLAAVWDKSSDRIVFIDKEGKVVIAQEPGQENKWEYTATGGFKNGIASVAAHSPYANQHSGPIMYDMDGVIEIVRILKAVPTNSKVMVNGKEVSFDAYNIKGNNYFKLRDLAYILNGTEKQFEVTWNGKKNAIMLISQKPYTRVGGEMASKGSGSKRATPTTSRIYLDDLTIPVAAYNIEDNNYFKLRDIGQAFNFGVVWDGENNVILINTNTSYVPE